jgi:WD40 repeat protein
MTSGSWDTITNVFDLRRKDPFAEPAKVIENPSGVHSLAVSLDNRRILSGSTTGPTVLELNGEATSYRLPASDVTSVALTPDGRRAVTGSDLNVRIWELELEDLLATAKQLVGSD